MANELRDYLGPDVVRFSAPVRWSPDDKNGVRVSTPKADFNARKAIIAVARPHLRKIHFDPPLPPEMTEPGRDMPMAASTMVFAAYKISFWSDNFFIGEKFNLTGFAGIAHDMTVPSRLLTNNISHEEAMRMASVASNSVRQLAHLTPSEQRSIVLEELIASFGPAASEPDAVFIHTSWARTDTPAVLRRSFDPDHGQSWEPG